MTMECQGNHLNRDENIPHRGEVRPYVSRSGATVTNRCEAHQDSYNESMDALEREQQRKFPGYDVPGSAPPDWFDASYAGERWDDDY